MSGKDFFIIWSEVWPSEQQPNIERHGEYQITEYSSFLEMRYQDIDDSGKGYRIKCISGPYDALYKAEKEFCLLTGGPIPKTADQARTDYMDAQAWRYDGHHISH
jgi:hypothetical protein